MYELFSVQTALFAIHGSSCRDVQRSQTTRHFKRLCALVLTDRKQQNQRVQLNSGLSYHIKLVAEPLLDSFFWSAASWSALWVVWTGGPELLRCVQDRGQRLCPPDARARAANFPLVEEIPETRLKINKPARLLHEQNTRFKWGYGVFRRLSVNSTFPIRFVETSVIAEGSL